MGTFTVLSDHGKRGKDLNLQLKEIGKEENKPKFTKME